MGKGDTYLSVAEALGTIDQENSRVWSYLVWMEVDGLHAST